MVKKRTPKNLDCLKAPTEKQIHEQIALFLTYAFTDPGIDWETIETSNQQGDIAGFMKQTALKAKGVKAGTPDILITYNPDLRAHLHFILRLEVKSKTGGLQDSQKRRIPELMKTGQFVEIVRNLDDVEAALCKYKIPHRASL